MNNNCNFPKIITNPSVLFCDEPTSGLDSFMALSIAEIMKDLALKGKTIICSIHQPSTEIYELFDKLCLLAEGRLAFLGNLNNAQTFFSSQGLVAPANYNPAYFYIKNISDNSTNEDKSPSKSNVIILVLDLDTCYIGLFSISILFNSEK